MHKGNLAVLEAEEIFTSEGTVLPVLNIKPVVEGIARVLPKLIALLQSDTIRKHPIWSKLFPYDISNYGRGKRSIGHCIGLDLIIAEDGIYVSEFDFVPSGRGFILASLPESGAEAVLETFAAWYKSMRLSEEPDRELSYYYATGTRTSCWPETVHFCERLRNYGVVIDPINMDLLAKKGGRLDRIVDRLFYQSELVHVGNLPKCRIITKEPYLDSKMVSALIHDSYMTVTLTEALGEQGLALLRRVVPMTYALDIMRERYPEVLVQVSDDLNRYGWLIKNTDVETDASWGCRGVVLGTNYTKAQFADALVRNVSPGNKDIGKHPVLQRFHRSVSFASLWNGVVHGSICSPDPSVFGREVDVNATSDYTNSHVHARVRPYILLDTTNDQAFIPPYAITTLRQDALSHGASDALFAACAMK